MWPLVKMYCPPLAWMVPHFPLLREQTVFQKHFGADRKSFTMSSPNFSHTRCCASFTAEDAALQACRFFATVSVDLHDNISRRASLTTSVHHGVRGLPPFEAPKTLRPQLSPTLNTAQSGSMPPTSAGMPEKPRRRCELKISLTGTSNKHS